MPAPAKPISRLLVANRGEIATRIISTARELGLHVTALYTENDISHAYNATSALLLPSPEAYLDIPFLVGHCKENNIDAVHPGYGFLSESPAFASALASAGIAFVGPSPDVLQRTGDKLSARLLAEECDVPVLPALARPTDEVAVVREFVAGAGLPVMIKAVDGGGGRGIRLVREEAELEGAVRRAVEESPSRKVFVEKAAVDGYRHVEVQVVGDGRAVTHCWERECSVQRRYQKVVEMAPSTLADRGLVGEVIAAALRMARRVGYSSLGTWEFLVGKEGFFFLEVNPRLQVEHTVTESICGIDLVRAQLLIAQGASLDEVGLPVRSGKESPPAMHSLQLRVTAEDPGKNWSLSVGKIQSAHFPSGNGVRCDTNIVHGIPTAVTADFDSLLAKVIITASKWEALLQKARRALQDTRIMGVQTNLAALQAIIDHPDFVAGRCDTRWLEANQSELVDKASRPPPHGFGHDLFQASSSAASASLPSLSQLLFKKDDAWTVSLQSASGSSQMPPKSYHLHLSRLLKNDFPSSLAAEISVTSTSSGTDASAQSVAYKLLLDQTSMSASAAASASNRPKYDPKNKSHVPIPFAGKLVEIHIDEGDEVREGETLFVVRQMKMELEVRSPRSGKVDWVLEIEEGEDVGEGWLGAVVHARDDKGKL